MGLEDADQSLVESSPENVSQSQKKSNITYTREFLLSFSELDICKKLPRGFDSSILSELEEASSSIIERHRGWGDYGPPHGKLDSSSTYSRPDSSSTYSRGSSGGRWDTRSSGSSDRDVDSQSERESFQSERRYGSQYRRNWQSGMEHDGLLGRPSGFVGPTGPKSHVGPQYQLSRSTEPYQPPRPYKAVPVSRRDGIDSCNDETFGSTECSSQDRAEEERKRRVSFEMMRKEQQKALQENQNKREKPRDIMDLLQSSSTSSDNTKIPITDKNRESDENTPSSPISPHDHTKPSSVVPVSLSRPLVPPGFASSGGERKIHSQLSDASIELEGRNIFTGNEAQKLDQSAGSESYIASGTPKTTQSATQDNSISILEKFFGTALSAGSGSSPSFVEIENQHPKAEDETLVPAVSESSKFAPWFIEEDTKPAEDSSSKDLLSLFAKNKEKSNSNPNSNSFGQISPKTLDFTFTDPSTTANGPHVPVSNPPILTCEDLEQSILAQATIPIPINNNNVSGAHNTVAKADVDNQASHHLLSLLHKGTNSTTTTKEENTTEISTSASDFEIFPADSGKNLTLETLFGPAFMNELQSLDAAPVSARRTAAPAQDLGLGLGFPHSRNSSNTASATTSFGVNLPEEDNLIVLNEVSLDPNQNPSGLCGPHDPRLMDLADRSNHRMRFDPGRLLQGINSSSVGGGGPQFDFDFDPASRRHLMLQNANFRPQPQPHPQPHPQPQPQPHHHHQNQNQNQNYMHLNMTHMPRHHEMNSNVVRGNFPVPHQQQTNNPGLGLGMPGPAGGGEYGGSGGAHAEAMERLIQMEMRAKSSKIPGFYAPELDTNFRFR